MKKLRKAVSILLALVMILGMTGTAMADDPATYTITINNDKSGHTYEAYQIFTGDLDSTKAVLSNVDWGSGIANGNTFISALKTDTTVVDQDADNNITVKDLFASCSTAADVAQVLSDNNSNTELAKVFAQIASKNLSTTVAGTSTENASPYTISGLEAGYYLVKDEDESVTANGDAYTDIILEVVADVEVTAKAVYPTVKKEANKDTANIGDTITYTLTGEVPDTSAYGSYTYIFHDTLSDGLTYVENSLEVTVDGADLTKDTDYTLTVSAQTIIVEMKNAKALSEKTIIVTYKATLNDKAVIGNGTPSDADSVDGNINKVYVEYSNNPNWVGDGEPTGNTPEDEVVTFTFELDVTKVDGKDTNKTLEDAEFVFYKKVDATNYYVIVDSDKKVSSWTTEKNSASTLKSDADGYFSIIGLDVGTYYLEETKAPDGYNLLADPLEIVIAAKYDDENGDGLKEVTELTVNVDNTGEVESTDTNKSSVDVKVENNAGATLPSTGGIGTTIFYVVGGILVVAAAVLLITKGRMSRSE